MKSRLLGLRDSGASLLTTYYYRVVAVQGTTKSKASLLAYGTPTEYDRQLRLTRRRAAGTRPTTATTTATATSTTTTGTTTD